MRAGENPVCPVTDGNVFESENMVIFDGVEAVSRTSCPNGKGGKAEHLMAFNVDLCEPRRRQRNRQASRRRKSSRNDPGCYYVEMVPCPTVSCLVSQPTIALTDGHNQGGLAAEPVDRFIVVPQKCLHVAQFDIIEVPYGATWSVNARRILGLFLKQRF
jgi:hypothetical protein